MQIPRPSKTQIPSKYSPLGMKELPFPNEAVVNPYSSDPRKNGSIYATSPVKDEIEKFENLLIRPDDFTNRVRLAYLWSKGDQQSGRGMGKTALLRYFRQRINKDWGATEFTEQFNAVVVYVAFPSQVDRRYMEQLALSALVDICRNGVLEASRAALRLKHLTEEQANAIMKNDDGSQDGANILNDAILTTNIVDVMKLDRDAPPVAGIAHPLAWLFGAAPIGLACFAGDVHWAFAVAMTGIPFVALFARRAIRTRIVEREAMIALMKRSKR